MNEILIKMVNDWWNAEGMELASLLSELSGDKSFLEKLHISDRANVFNYAKIDAIHNDKVEAKNYLLKEICGEFAEQVLASKYGVSSDELFDEDGSFYEQYQEEFNRLYDQIEEQMMYLDKCNKSINN
jgi:hypothetical protein